MKIIFTARVADDEGKLLYSIDGTAEYSDMGKCLKTSVDSSNLGDGDKAKKRSKNVVLAISEVICEKLVFKGKKD